MNHKVIIMYITHGSGHHKAALAIEKAIKSLKYQQEILTIDGFKYVHPIMNKITHAVYMSVIQKVPRIWDTIYDNDSFASKINRLKENIHKKDREKIKGLIEPENAKVVICTQAFPCGLVADYKKFCNDQLRLIAVITDFIPHSYWVYDEVDFYVVGSEEAGQILVSRGISEEKIKYYGIPIDPKFSLKKDKEILAKEFGLYLDRATVLVMGGGRGLGPIKDLIKGLEATHFTINLLVVTGLNKNLFNCLSAFKSKHNLRIFGHIDYVEKLMSVADILITKPGGLTAAEALAKDLPMIIVNPLPGQEQKNTQYILNKNLGLKCNNVKDIIYKLTSLLNDRGKLEILKKEISKHSLPNSSVEVAKLVLSLC